MIDVRIGVAQNPKELSLESDEDVEKVVDKVNAALAGETDLLWLTDSRGKRVGIPKGKIAYVEVESRGGGSRTVGFGPG